MSLQAMVWALSEPRVQSPSQRCVLIALANEADSRGRNAFPSARTIASSICVSSRTVQSRLRELEDLGLIVRGDQRKVAYLPYYARPVVFDLCMTGERSGVGLVSRDCGHPTQNLRRVCGDGELAGIADGSDGVGRMPDCTRFDDGTGEIADDIEPEPVAGEDLEASDPTQILRRVGDDDPTKASSPGENFVGYPTKTLAYYPTTTHYPSPPSGGLPTGEARPENVPIGDEARDGPTAGESDHWFTGTEWAGLSPELAVLRLMADCLGQRPAVPVPDDLRAGGTGRCLAAARQLVEARGLVAVRAMVRFALLPPGVDGACRDGFWRGVITDPRRLERKWDQLVAQLARDAALPAVRETPDSSRPSWRSCPHVHAVGCVHVLKIVDSSTILRSIEPDDARRHAHDADVAKQLNANVSPVAIVEWLSDVLKGVRQLQGVHNDA